MADLGYVPTVAIGFIAAFVVDFIAMAYRQVYEILRVVR